MFIELGCLSRQHQFKGFFLGESSILKCFFVNFPFGYFRIYSFFFAVEVVFEDQIFFFRDADVSEHFVHAFILVEGDFAVILEMMMYAV